MEENVTAYVGTNVELTWNTLDGLGKVDVKQLKKAAKIRTEKNVYTTPSWLAREKKLTFVYEDGILLVSLR